MPSESRASRSGPTCPAGKLDDVAPGIELDLMSIGKISQKKYLSQRIFNNTGDVRKSWTSQIL
jgi:hypothetical protein